MNRERPGMCRRRHALIASAIVLLLLTPAVAGGARAVKGTFLNKSHTNGVRLETTRHNVNTISFYCKRTRYDLVQSVGVRRDGSFSFHGKMTRYGPEGQPGGKKRARFSGRFTSHKRVRIHRVLSRCGSAMVKAKGKRG